MTEPNVLTTEQLDKSIRARRRFGPFLYAPLPRPKHGDYFDIKLVGIVGILTTFGHEVVYRQTGGDDFPLVFVSHAGVDMLLLLALVLTVLALSATGRIR